MRWEDGQTIEKGAFWEWGAPEGTAGRSSGALPALPLTPCVCVASPRKCFKEGKRPSLISCLSFVLGQREEWMRLKNISLDVCHFEVLTSKIITLIDRRIFRLRMFNDICHNCLMSLRILREYVSFLLSMITADRLWLPILRKLIKQTIDWKAYWKALFRTYFNSKSMHDVLTNVYGKDKWHRQIWEKFVVNNVMNIKELNT